MGVVVYRVPKQRKREEIVKDIVFNANPNERLQMELLLDIRDLLRAIALREGIQVE